MVLGVTHIDQTHFFENLLKHALKQANMTAVAIAVLHTSWLWLMYIGKTYGFAILIDDTLQGNLCQKL